MKYKGKKKDLNQSTMSFKMNTT